MQVIDTAGVDAEIVVATGKTQAAQGVAGRLFGFGFAQLAIGGQLVMVGDDAKSDLDNVMEPFPCGHPASFMLFELEEGGDTPTPTDRPGSVQPEAAFG